MSNSVINTVLVSDPPLLALDAEKLAGAGPAGQDIFRERIQVTGAILAEIATVKLAPPVGAIYGLTVRVVAAQTGTTTSVATSTASATLLAANTNRLGVIITNDSTHRLFVKCGATASTTSYTKQLGANEDWQVPFGYVGIIDGILNTGTGNARITEFV